MEAPPRPEDDQASETALSAAIDVMAVLGRLARNEAALARASARAAVHRAGVALGLILGAVIVALAAIGALTGAAIAGLVAAGLPVGWAAALVGVALFVVAIVMVRTGVRHLSLAARAGARPVQNLQRDAQTLMQKVSADAET